MERPSGQGGKLENRDTPIVSWCRRVSFRYSCMLLGPCVRIGVMQGVLGWCRERANVYLLGDLDSRLGFLSMEDQAYLDAPYLSIRLA